MKSTLIIIFSSWTLSFFPILRTFFIFSRYTVFQKNSKNGITCQFKAKYNNFEGAIVSLCLEDASLIFIALNRFFIKIFNCFCIISAVFTLSANICIVAKLLATAFDTKKTFCHCIHTFYHFWLSYSQIHICISFSDRAQSIYYTTLINSCHWFQHFLNLCIKTYYNIFKCIQSLRETGNLSGSSTYTLNNIFHKCFFYYNFLPISSSSFITLTFFASSSLALA